MAVLIQFTTVLIRIDRLLAVAPDGLATITDRWSPSWRDEHLLAVAFMDMGARDLAAELEHMGLTLRDTSSGTRVWRDICVVDYFDGPTNPCEWLAYDHERHAAWLKGTAPGELVGPDHPHEHAPVRVSPEQFAKLVQASVPPPSKSTAIVRNHEAVLLPLTHQLAAQLLRAVPTSAKVEAIIFVAHFAGPGQVVHSGLILHDLAGQLSAIRIAHLGDEAHRLLRELSSYDSDQALTSIEIKIAADGRTTTHFGIAAPLSAEALDAHMQRLYGNVPRARAPTLPAAGCLFGWLRPIFGPRLKLYPQLALQHQAPRDPLSMLLDELKGIQEHWDEPPDAAPAPASSASPAPFALDLDAFRALEQARIPRPPRPDGKAHPIPPGPPAIAGEHLTVPDAPGVLFAEVSDLRDVPLAELHRARPTLRFDPLRECLIRDLGPDVGELRFGSWRGKVSRLEIEVEDIPSIDALLARVQPILVALGGLGPVVSALGSPEPSQIREAIPVPLAELRAALVPDSPYGRRVYPCWLLGAPAPTKVGLDLSVGLTDGRPSFGYRVHVRLP